MREKDGKSYVLNRYTECMDKMTSLSPIKREEYMQWLSKQNEAVMVMIMKKMRKRYYFQKKKYQHSSCYDAIFLAAMIETISIYCESDKDIEKIDFAALWFDKSYIENTRRTLIKYRYYGV